MAITSPRSSVRETPPAPEDWNRDNLPEWLRRVAEVANRILIGGLNNGGSVTLAANQTTTVVTDHRVHANSDVFLNPTTENAAGEVGHYVSSYGDGTFTIAHANDARTDRTFSYRIFG